MPTIANTSNSLWQSSSAASKSSIWYLPSRHAAIATCLRIRTCSLLLSICTFAPKLHHQISCFALRDQLGFGALISLMQRRACWELGSGSRHSNSCCSSMGSRSCIIIQAHPPCVRASPGCLQQKSPVLRCIVLFECVFGNLEKMVGWLVVNYSQKKYFRIKHLVNRWCSCDIGKISESSIVFLFLLSRWPAK